MTGLCGILPAIITPLDSAERFQPRAFECLLERLYNAGVHGIYVCGQTGEGLLQSIEQRKAIAEVAVKWSPEDKKVIVHVGAYRTADAIELARHAARVGAHAVSSLPPLGGYSFAEVKAYYQALAELSDVPLLVYYFPELCSTIASADQILELCSMTNVIGLKFTDFDLCRMSLVKDSGAVIFNDRMRCSWRDC